MSYWKHDCGHHKKERHDCDDYKKDKYRYEEKDYNYDYYYKKYYVKKCYCRFEPYYPHHKKDCKNKYDNY
ncbi:MULTISPECIES: hypothetical protein [Bacillus cereus group]|uniref:hypothetical protein n=1 Tax=Bacillus cereus group TaxID=86661 RepID=UPI0018F45930|nr:MULTISPECIES: hypothetical protein [Bacillus cereus group]MBJ7967668.1 hypothetical protein [Bacillus cereus]MBJ8004053.1 hypothetical protein [Bacillus cereus]MCC2543732.1 hypothetical protein [Bacillus thuringiensis]